MLPDRRAPAYKVMNRSAPPVNSPAAIVAAAYHGVRAAMPLDLLPDETSSLFDTAADSPRLPNARSYHSY